MAAHPALLALAQAIPDQVRLLALDPGDRVAISLDGVTATGTVAHMSLHWSTMKGINTWPVVLDGTGAEVEVHASLLERISP